MDRPLVKNTADREQVDSARKKEKLARFQEISDLQAILSAVQGRRFIWRLLARAKTFESIWDPSSKIHFNAGQQDFGHFILAELMEADPNAFIKMMEENKKEKETNARTNSNDSAGTTEGA